MSIESLLVEFVVLALGFAVGFYINERAIRHDEEERKGRRL
jgi:hypothetical protein